ncbi:amine oxidase [Bacillus sp. AFS001701]|uniref:flavin monoamine oxidase family protein n=2 Tax=Bacillaceae TaxID=186817 RepID=UPI000BF39C24|nr:flavin monoamine oxidase family protein [Bacillus sp. AFS001701]PET75350.1 amine oxidase [Bacillus sp. AFS001701]
MEEMLEIIQNGLTKTISPKRVTIIGGGISGLVSASLLKEAGHQVTIIEANRRIGGRIYTKREPFLEYQYIELGAMRIPSFHHLTFALINKFNLQVNEFINSTPNDLIYLNNVLTNQKTYESNPDILKYSVLPNEKGKTAVELLLTAIGPVIDFINQDPDKNWDIIIDKYDQYSMENFLKYNPVGNSLSTGAIDMIKAIVGLEGFPELGFTAILREVIILLTPNLKLYEITGGTDHLVRAFLPQLRDNIILNERVTKIIQGDSNVTIHTENEILTRQSQYECDYVISTIPYSLFNFVDIFPYESISDKKWKVIRELHYADSTKIAIQFRTKFWERFGLYGGKLTTDLPIKFSYFPSHDMGFKTGIMLASYTWEDDAVIWDHMKNNKRIDKALANLSMIFGDVVYKEFLVGYSHSWTQFSFSGGAFIMYKPNQQKELGPYINSPEGRIHFGGSHASSTPGWMQGAIEAGIRTANEINNL